jgi:hypothetical protein
VLMNGQQGRVGGTCTRISGVVLRRRHPSSGMWRSRGNTVLCVMRIELRIPLARGQNPYAPEKGWNAPPERGGGDTPRTLRGRAVMRRAVGAHTTEEVIRQGSRVSLCAGLHVVASVSSGVRCDESNLSRAGERKCKTPHLALGAGGA